MKLKIPNILTIGRIIIVPIFVVTFFIPGLFGDLTRGFIRSNKVMALLTSNFGLMDLPSAIKMIGELDRITPPQSEDVKAEDKTKTIQELDREKLEQKFSNEDKEKLN